MNKETIILHAFITKCYTEYGSFIKNYISYRIPHKYEAEDLTQEVFIRLLDYKQFINPETIKPFLLTIATKPNYRQYTIILIKSKITHRRYMKR
mgnify:CR=1 FL=1